MNSPYHRQIGEIDRELAELARKRESAAEKAAEAADDLRAVMRKASDARASSRTESYMKDAKRFRERVAEARGQMAEIERSMETKRNQKEELKEKLNRAESRAIRTRQCQGETRAIEHEKQIEEINERLSKLRSYRIPEQITVLLLAANPQDQNRLQLGEEARIIGEMIRKSKHRDAIRLETREAAQPLDLLQAINECTPTVIHFCGHGSPQDDIVFQDDRGHTKLVTKEALSQTIAAASGDIRLLFFNACHSSRQAGAVVKHVEAAIGMKDSISDAAARVFAAAFYSAVGFGLSVQKAFKQAKAALMMERIPEQDTPELFIGEGLAGDEIVLVKVPDSSTGQEEGIDTRPGV